MLHLSYLMITSMMSHQSATYSASKSKVPTTAGKNIRKFSKTEIAEAPSHHLLPSGWLGVRNQHDKIRVPWILLDTLSSGRFSTSDSAFIIKGLWRLSEVIQSIPYKPGSTAFILL